MQLVKIIGTHTWYQIEMASPIIQQKKNRHTSIEKKTWTRKETFEKQKQL